MPKKKLPLDLDCGRSFGQTVPVVCVRRPFDADGLKLWDKLKDLSVGAFATDHWKSYEDFIPPEQHRQTKVETFTVEGYNSRLW